MNLQLRPATANDVPVISQLAGIIWREHYPSVISTEQIEYMLATRYSVDAVSESMTRGEKYFLAYANQQPLAYASVEQVNGCYFLHKFYVNVQDHRRGTGSALFSYLLQQLESEVPIRLQVNRQNFKAINFYFKQGFNIEATGDFDIGNGYYMNDFIMVRSAASKGS